jgi:hypothetical protein
MMGRGGARQGAGRPKKPLADKILEGNPSKRPLTIVEFPNAAELQGGEMPAPSEFMEAKQRVGKDLLAVRLYKDQFHALNPPRRAHRILLDHHRRYEVRAFAFFQPRPCLFV